MDCRIQIIHTVAPWNANVESIMETLWRLLTVSVTLIMGYNRSYLRRWLGFTLLAYEQCNEKKNPVKKKTKSKIKTKTFSTSPLLFQKGISTHLTKLNNLLSWENWIRWTPSKTHWDVVLPKVWDLRRFHPCLPVKSYFPCIRMTRWHWKSALDWSFC